MSTLYSVGQRLAPIVREFFAFLWERKLWWMVPMVAVIFIFGLLLALGQSSALAPFVYTIF